jgi:GYF domain 2
MSDANSVDLGWGAAAPAGTAGTPGTLWQVNTRGRKVVEMTLAELLQGFKAGKLTTRSLVWNEGMPEWAPLGEVTKLARLLRADSEPPASGARLIGDEAEPLAGTKNYTSSGSEPPTDPGTLAIYERPLATIEFPEPIEAPPDSVDDLTPALIPPKTNIRATLPGIAPEDVMPLSASELEPLPPPLPSRPQAAFPTPVSASPLGAALSSMAAQGSAPMTAAKPAAPLPGASYAVAKATSVPSTASLKLPSLAKTPGSATETPKFMATGAATSTPNPFATTSNPKPIAAVSGPKPISVTATPNPLGAAPKLPHDAVPPAPPAPAGSNASVVSPPRPAIEFLPPIIVQEKDDDGASIITLPLAPMPLETQFNESTLVLSGRRRPKRWVPLGAAVAAAVGAACLASALTALVVRSQPMPPRSVEKRVLATATPAPEAVPTSVEATAAATRPSIPDAEASIPDAEKTNPTTERSASKGNGPNATKAWRKDDPGALEAAGSSRRELRAGFPTNPGF